MKAAALLISLAALASACSYSHIGQTMATFTRLETASATETNHASDAPLVLNIRRHIDTVLRGPDIEEDQHLRLEVRRVRLNQRLSVPSDKVIADFTATRFGPPSKGVDFSGFLIVTKIATNLVTANVHVDVTARTESGSYTEQVKFRSEYKFFREATNE